MTTQQKSCRQDQFQPLQLPGVSRTALCGIDPGGTDMGMTQSIRQPGQIFFQWIIRPGKQVPQIMGEHLVWLHSRAFTKSFHIPPDIGAVKGLSRPRHEHRSVGDLLLFQVFFSSPHSFPGRKTVRRFPLLSTAHFLAAGQRPQTNIPSAGHLSAFVAEKGAL